jgi:DNA-binding HxlR family transcriptional regulator
MPNEKFDYQQIDNFIHSRIRLAIMAVLASVDEMDFNSIKKSVNTSDGNLSVHLKKLEENGYIKIEKKFINRKPLTTCQLTKKGMQSFTDYITTVENFLQKSKDQNRGDKT